MYRRPKFLEVLLEIRQEMAREADYDVDLFAEMVRSNGAAAGPVRLHDLSENETNGKKTPKAGSPARRRAADGEAGT